jgi:hypothetical protein
MALAKRDEDGAAIADIEEGEGAWVGAQGAARQTAGEPGFFATDYTDALHHPLCLIHGTKSTSAWILISLPPRTLVFCRGRWADESWRCK